MNSFALKRPSHAARRLTILIALCACVLAPLSLHAAFSISAETDKKTVEINDNLYLTITVSGDSASVPEPSLPQMNNFNVYSSGRSQNISIINGKIFTSVAFTYILTPRFIGKQTIPPISVFNGREKHLTPEIAVEVVKAAAQAQAPQPQAQQGSSGRQGARPQSAKAQRQPTSDEMLFMTAEPDKKTAYPNEQVNLTVRFYTAVPLTSNPQYIPPTFKNLISEDLPPVKNGESIIKGVRYNYSEIKTALFGVETGDEARRNQLLCKGVTNEQIEQTAALLRKHRIHFFTSNILALPGEHWADALATLRLNQRLRAPDVWCSIFQPYAGLPITEQAIRDGLLARVDDDVIGANTFADNALRNPDAERIFNLHKFFYPLARWPRLEKILLPLTRWKPNRLFHYFWLIFYVHSYRQHTGVSRRRIALEGLFWFRQFLSTTGTRR